MMKSVWVSISSPRVSGCGAGVRPDQNLEPTRPRKKMATYGLTIADVVLPNRTKVNHTLIKLIEKGWRGGMGNMVRGIWYWSS
jgi:hypothetical protein